MAIVKAKYVKRGKNEKDRAKAHVRYIQQRPGKTGERFTRTLFGRDGLMERTDAYLMIDHAVKTDILFKFIISPDPQAEDNKKDINMREITHTAMLKLEEITGKTVLWTASLHNDHTDKRHVHALAVVPGRLYTSHLNLLTHEATKACLEQRRELDLIHRQQQRQRQQREEAEWRRGL